MNDDKKKKMRGNLTKTEANTRRNVRTQSGGGGKRQTDRQIDRQTSAKAVPWAAAVALPELAQVA